MKLWLVRHAQVVAPSGVCYGASEVAADIAETERCAAAFSTLPLVGAPVWTSPLGRAQQFATELARLRPDLVGPFVADELAEMNFGLWEMVSWDAIPREHIDEWTINFAEHRFGGIESVSDVLFRVECALKRAQSLTQPEMVFITHAGVIRAIQWFLTPRNVRKTIAADHWPSFAPSMGSWMAIEV